MNFIYATLAWLVIGSLLGAGLYLMVVRSSPWLFIISALGFLIAVAKIAYLHH